MVHGDTNERRLMMMRQLRFRLQRRGANMLAIIVVLGIAVVVVVAVMKSGIGPDGLYSHIDEYKAMLDKQSGSLSDSGAAAAGPAVVVDYDYGRIDDLMKSLPSSMRAEMASDVVTVVVITRQSTGIGGGGGGGVLPVMNQQGSYSIAAYLFDANGEPIDAHSISRKTAITGAGAEGEMRSKTDPEMAAWIVARLGG